MMYKKKTICLIVLLILITVLSISAQEKKGKKKKNRRPKYSVEQAVSDNAQLHTIAFNALAYFTGDLGSDTFFPPGKVTDFYGFQYLRDVDKGGLGHNMQFLSKIAENVLFILTEDQKKQLINLAAEQADLFESYAYKRFPLIKAFRRNMENDFPPGKKDLSEKGVIKYSGDLYEIDAKLTYRRSEVMGKIIRNMNSNQIEYMDMLKNGHSGIWPEKKEQIDKRSMSHTEHVLVMTYASELFSWYAGDIEADTYFCPERHGTYFGSFYMKDMPAMGKPDYSISTEITGDSGADFLKMLTDEQRKKITDLIDIQRENLTEIVNVRRKISEQLRGFISGNPPSEKEIHTMVRKYGELDGENNYHYIKAYSEVYQSLDKEQLEKMVILRNLDDYKTDGAFVYSEEIKMPEIENTDYLFE